MKKTPTGDAKVAVAYLRVSTDDQALGPEAQRASIERWAAGRGIRIVGFHEDRLSGATAADERPGLLAAIEAVRATGAGLLVAARRDRIARDVAVAAVVERLVWGAGAQVATADGVSIEQTPEGQLLRTMLDAFAQFERALIRARTKSALQVKRARGERITRRAPIGYRHEDGRVVLDEGEQEVLVRVREMRTRGVSVARIASVLNAQGVRCRGGRWHETTIRRVLAKDAVAVAA